MEKRHIALAAAGFFIIGAIWLIDAQKNPLGGNTEPVDADIPLATTTVGADTGNPGVVGNGGSVSPATEATAKSLAAKKGTYSRAKELVNPTVYHNTHVISVRPNSDVITIKDFIGKKVILVDFWTYSCINCQRTIPYLNDWWNKYKDKGLLIIGVHTPEFSFEKEQTNVVKAISRLGIGYPVVQDDNKETWNAYGNRYWPHEYLIDIDGYIAYDHIGEGNYDVTEKKIQDLLAERANRLGTDKNVKAPLTDGTSIVAPGKVRTGEIYLGAFRNSEFLGNGVAGKEGVQDIPAAHTFLPDLAYFTGSWNFSKEYTTNVTPGASFKLNYGASRVYIVMSAPKMMRVKVLIDGQPAGVRMGSDVKPDKDDSVLQVSDQRLYNVVVDPAGYGVHTLEIIPDAPGLNLYSITFG